MGACATSDTDNNTLYTINTLHDKRAPHATATHVFLFKYSWSDVISYFKIVTLHLLSPFMLQYLLIKHIHDQFLMSNSTTTILRKPFTNF